MLKKAVLGLAVALLLTWAALLLLNRPNQPSGSSLTAGPTPPAERPLPPVPNSPTPGPSQAAAGQPPAYGPARSAPTPTLTPGGRDLAPPHLRRFLRTPTPVPTPTAEPAGRQLSNTPEPTASPAAADDAATPPATTAPTLQPNTPTVPATPPPGSPDQPDQPNHPEPTLPPAPEPTHAPEPDPQPTPKPTASPATTATPAPTRTAPPPPATPLPPATPRPPRANEEDRDQALPRSGTVRLRISREPGSRPDPRTMSLFAEIVAWVENYLDKPIERSRLPENTLQLTLQNIQGQPGHIVLRDPDYETPRRREELAHRLVREVAWYYLPPGFPQEDWYRDGDRLFPQAAWLRDGARHFLAELRHLQSESIGHSHGHGGDAGSGHGGGSGSHAASHQCGPFANLKDTETDRVAPDRDEYWYCPEEMANHLFQQLREDYRRSRSGSRTFQLAFQALFHADTKGEDAVSRLHTAFPDHAAVIAEHYDGSGS